MLLDNGLSNQTLDSCLRPITLSLCLIVLWTLAGCGLWVRGVVLDGPWLLPFQEPAFLCHGLEVPRDGMPKFSAEKPDECLRLAKLWDARSLLHVDRCPLQPGYFSRVFNAYKDTQRDRQIGDRRLITWVWSLPWGVMKFCCKVPGYFQRAIASKETFAFPVTSKWEALVIDDYFCLGSEPLGADAGVSFPKRALDLARDTYDTHGCLSVLSLRASRLGGLNAGLASRLAGNWVSVLRYRKVWSSSIDVLFLLAARCQTDPTQVFAMSRSVAQELVMLAAIAPLIMTNIAVEHLGFVLPGMLPFTKAQLSMRQLRQHLWLDSDKSGSYTQLDHPFGAALRRLGEFDEDEAVATPFPEPPGLFKAPLLYFDFVQICGGAGKADRERMLQRSGAMPLPTKAAKEQTRGRRKAPAQWRVGLRIRVVARESYLEPNVAVMNATLGALGSGSQWAYVLQLLMQMSQERLTPNTISLNTALRACADAGQWRLAVATFALFKELELKTTNISHTSLMGALANATRWQEARLPGHGSKQGFGGEDFRSFSIMLMGLMGVCGSCEAIDELMRLDRLPDVHADLIAYNAALTACSRSASSSAALQLLKDLEAHGLKANITSYNIALSCLAGAGAWEAALMLLEEVDQGAVVLELVEF
eukprot:s103_g36.t3